jgi:hypothetical protein
VEEVRLAGLDTGEAERLAELEEQKVRCFERMGRLAEELKAAQRELFAVEKDQRRELKRVPEHVVPEDRELTHEDFELWAESVFWSHAKTMPVNPHQYVARKRCEHPEMYERAVAFVLANGYDQRYYSTTYRCYDFELHGKRFFCWPMTDRPEESEILNAKPSSMKPEQGSLNGKEGRG